MSDDRVEESAVIDEDATPAKDGADSEHAATDDVVVAPASRPQYGVGPFSIREVVLVGVWVVAFVISFFSVASQQAMAQLLFGGSVWTNGLDWILTIGVPTIAVFLIVLRRFSPDGIRRVGSLGIDQFASVAFSVSAVVWLTLLWRNVAVVIESRVWIYGWVVWLEFFLMLIGVALTVFAPVIPVLAEDFAGRREVPAHRSARPIRPVAARPPRPSRPTAEPARTDPADPANPYATDPANPYATDPANPYATDPANPYATAAYPAGAYGTDPAFAARENDADAHDTAGIETGNDASGYDSSQDGTATTASQTAWAATGSTEQQAADDAASNRQQAFWALVPEERDVVDDRDVPIFRIGPTAWALVLEDRGEVYVVRHEDGRVGYLHDVSGVTRG